MRAIKLVVLAAIVLWPGIVSQLRAELPPLSVEDLKRESDFVVRGKVARVYSVLHEQRPGFTDRMFAIELTVSAVDQGQGVQPGQVIFFRTWKSESRPRGWAGPGGQTQVPKAGDEITAYLSEEDGALDALLPNGIAIQRPAGK